MTGPNLGTGSANSYRALFAIPGTARLYFGYLLARMPVGVIGLSLLLLGQDTGGTARSGLLVGAFSAALMIATPLLGRALDTFPPGRVLSLAATAQCAALALLAICWSTSEPETGLLLTGALLAGASLPPAGPALRVALPVFVPDDLLTTGFTAEAVILETVYIIGPLLVGGLGAVAGWLPLAAAGGCTAAGVAVMLSSGRLAGACVDTPPARALWTLGPLADGGVRRLLLGAFLFLPALAVVEVGVAAVAGERDRPELLGVVMAFSAVASLAGGLLFGLRRWPGSLASHVAVLAGWFAAASVLGALAPGPWPAGAAVVLGSLVVAPALALLGRIGGVVAPEGRAAETYTWLSTMNNCGQAATLPLAGLLAERSGPEGAFLLAATLAGTAALFILNNRRHLAPTTTSRPRETVRT
ncbi:MULTISPECIES: hypothetical protein [Actinomadura]|uniref:MFS transporter n=1 Tax=Actinomadura litoris TaxID=2678616 RepID=A0A7K1L1J4_9ACTN|nr:MULTISPECIES: hypothetical protein [Actinomadura]MBT2206572.1 hypothetical protein [Actinomadura sp. NEAU-AAG7]MUN38328.1 hypothetical protein [Actinomadura litoris]